jgi:hypothetical protein
MPDERHYDVTGTGAEYVTPLWIWEPLADAFGGWFDLDAASGCESTPIAQVRITADDDPDGLNADWGEYAGHVFLNPPYGITDNNVNLNAKWADKVAWELDKADIDTLTVLLPGSTSTNWYERAYAQAGLKTEIHTRVNFDSPEDADDNGASFASVIHSFGDFPAEYVRALHSLGENHPEAPDTDVGTTVWERAGRW